MCKQRTKRVWPQCFMHQHWRILCLPLSKRIRRRRKNLWRWALLNSWILPFVHSSFAVWTETGTGMVLFRIASWDCFRKRILYIFEIANKRNASVLRTDQNRCEKRAGTGERLGGGTIQSFTPAWQWWRNNCRRLQPRFVLFSTGVALMSCKVNFHLVRSAL